MKKTRIALLLALCMLITLSAASACCIDSCCVSSGMDETQTMEETCPCMMDGNGINGCPCMGDMCGEDCMCMDGKSCMNNGMTMEGCMCEKQCACGDSCACAEHQLEKLNDELNAVFEMHMEPWEKFFGMLDKEPDLEMVYADYLTEQLEGMKEKFTEDEYSLLQTDIEEVRRIHGEITMLMEKLMPEENSAAMCMADGECVSECACEAGVCTEHCGCMTGEMDSSADIKN